MTDQDASVTLTAHHHCRQTTGRDPASSGFVPWFSEQMTTSSHHFYKRSKSVLVWKKSCWSYWILNLAQILPLQLALIPQFQCSSYPTLD